MVFALLWQALIWLTPMGQAQHAQDIQNLATHAQWVDHHHHDDQSLHVDDSVDSQGHHHANESVQPAGLLPATNPHVAEVALAAPPVAYPLVWVSASLGVPLRPPQPLV